MVNIVNNLAIGNKKELFSIKNIIRGVAIVCVLCFILPNFSIIWRSYDANPVELTRGVSGLGYVGGITVSIGWGPGSQHEIGGAHPIALLCMLIPIAVFVVMCMKRVSDSALVLLSAFTVVDIIMWINMRSKVKALALRNDLYFEDTGVYVFNLFFMSVLLILILLVLILKKDLSMDIRQAFGKMPSMPQQATGNPVIVPLSAERCEKCGASLVKGSRFCSSCGTPVPENAPEKKSVFCPYCGKELPADSTFCLICGKKIKQSL